MGNIFHLLLYKPLFNLLIGLYNLIPDIGIAIIIVTVVIKLILHPLSRKAAKSQKALQILQPKLDALKEQYKDDKQKLAQATMELYKKEQISPFSSCLPILIQLPIVIAVYQVFRSGLGTNDFKELYSFVSNPGTINATMFGLSWLDLAKPQIFLGVLAGAAQFWQTRLLMSRKSVHKVNEPKKDPSMMEMMNKQMMYTMPIVTVLISASLPGGLALYWFFMTLLGALEQYIVNKKMEKDSGVPEVIDVK